MVSINLVVEGYTDEVVVRSILNSLDIDCSLVRGRSGKQHLLRNLKKYNNASKFAVWLVVVDLDQDAPCAPEYVKQILPTPHQGMIFRIAVQAIEAWLMADREHLSAYLGISASHVPQNPDAEANPKTTLINLARRCRKRALRDDLVPRDGSGARVGRGYPTRINEFVNQTENQWRPDIARQHSDSLDRCMKALIRWKNQN